MTLRTLVLGDWHPWMRDPIDVLRASLVVAVPGFALAGNASGAVLMAGAGAVSWAVRLVNLPRAYDLAYGWGSVRRIPGENRFEATEA